MINISAMAAEIKPIGNWILGDRGCQQAEEIRVPGRVFRQLASLCRLSFSGVLVPFGKLVQVDFCGSQQHSVLFSHYRYRSIGFCFDPVK